MESDIEKTQKIIYLGTDTLVDGTTANRVNQKAKLHDKLRVQFLENCMAENITLLDLQETISAIMGHYLLKISDRYGHEQADEVLEIWIETNKRFLALNKAGKFEQFKTQK